MCQLIEQCPLQNINVSINGAVSPTKNNVLIKAMYFRKKCSTHKLLLCNHDETLPYI